MYTIIHTYTYEHYIHMHTCIVTIMKTCMYITYCYMFYIHFSQHVSYFHASLMGTVTYTKPLVSWALGFHGKVAGVDVHSPDFPGRYRNIVRFDPCLLSVGKRPVSRDKMTKTHILFDGYDPIPNTVSDTRKVWVKTAYSVQYLHAQEPVFVSSSYCCSYVLY